MRLRPWRIRTSKPALARVYLLLGAILLAVGLLVYFQTLSIRLEDQAEDNGRLAAELVAFSTLAMQLAPDTTIVDRFTETLQGLNFPVVITNDVGRPLAWNDHVSERTLSQREILSENLNRPGPVMKTVLDELREMDRRHEALAILPPASDAPISMYLHYGSPDLLGELRLIPWITILIAAVFGFVGLLILRSIKRAEQSLIWAGLAKESAHQMGTPISSLMGWMEVLKDEVRFGPDGAALPRELFEEVVREIGQDADRLNRVAARFSQIGSRPRLVREPVRPMVEETVAYFRRRIPRGVELSAEVDEGAPEAEVNRELIVWVLENLIKNAMNAVGEGGRVAVSVRGVREGKAVAISVRDNGKGVAPGMERLIFRPGVSTRTRGWGLGLPLSRRIVEEYHRGRLDLTWTEEGKGAEFRLLLPAAGPRLPGTASTASS